MSRHEKLLKRLLSKPKDFEWQEAISLLDGLGFELLSGSGSRRKFRHKTSNLIISLHEPHPQKVLKAYAIQEIIDVLGEGGLLK